MMPSPTDRKLLGALLSRQEETGAAAELPPGRVAEIAAGSPPSADEAAALLASPLAREELVLHLRLERLRRVAAAHDARRVFRAPAEERLAAADGEAEAGGAFRLVCGDNAELWVAPGRTAASRFLVTVRLSPGTEGGAAGRLVEVREEGPDGLVWLAGRTDADGAVHRLWAHEGTTPHARRGAGAILRLLVLD